MAISFAVILFNDGGVYPASLSIAVMAMAIAACMICVRARLPRSTIWLCRLAFAVWLAVTLGFLLQAMPLSGALLQNAGHPAWQALAEAGLIVTSHISVAPADTVHALLPVTLVFLTFVTSLMLFRSDGEALGGLRVFAFCGGLMAIVAIIQSVAFPDMLMFSPKEAYFGSLTAPFVNRNTAATFYGVVFLVAMSLAGADLLAKGNRRGVRTYDERMRGGVVRAGMLLLAGTVALIALALTQSRGGVAATIAGGALLSVGLAIQAAGLSARARIIVFAGRSARGYRLACGAAGAIAFVAVCAMIFGRAYLRGEMQGGEDGRFCILPGILRAIGNHALAGSGAGAFRYEFPPFRDPACGLEAVWFRAHDVYLETVMALGGPFGLAVIITIGIALVAVHVGGLSRRRSLRPVVLGGLAALVVVIMHSAVDFSLQIPGFAMSAALVMALTATISSNVVKASQHLDKRKLSCAQFATDDFKNLIR